MATDLETSVASLITSSNIISDVINEDATTEVLTSNGTIPSLRKALNDNLYFQDPVPWNNGANETEFNQLRTFTDGTAWWAPSATTINPVPMGVTPIGDTNWYPFQDRNLTNAILEEVTRFNIKGTFAAGFDYETVDDVGLDSSDNPWLYTGSLPFTVVPGTIPSEPLYRQVAFSDHNATTDRNDFGAHDEIYYRQYPSLADLLVDANNQDLTVGSIYATQSYYATTDSDIFSFSRGGNTYLLVDAGSPGSRPTEDGGAVIHVTGGSGGLWLKGLFEDGLVWGEQFGMISDYDRVTGIGTDNTPFLNAAINYHRDRVDINEGFFKFDSSINMANKFAGALIVGRLGGRIGGAQQGTIFFGNTGEFPVVDFIGSQNAQLQQIVILTATNSTNPSKIGCYFARSTASPFAQFNSLRNVTIDLDSDPTAFSGRGTVAIVNIAAEIFSLYDTYGIGDTGFHMSSDNLWYNVSSLYGTQGGPPSNSTLQIYGNTVFQSRHPVGNPIRLLAVVFAEGSFYANGASGLGDPGELSGGLYVDGISRLHNLKIFTEQCDFPMTMGSGVQNCTYEFYGTYSPEYYIRKVTQTSIWACNSVNIAFRVTTDAAATPPNHWIVLNSGDTANNLKITAPERGAVQTNPLDGWIGITNGSILNVTNLSLETDTYQLEGTTQVTAAGDWQLPPLQVEGLYIWRNGNTLFVNPALPSSTTDGFAMYKTSNYPFGGGSSPGNVGDIARTGNTVAFYTGDGVTHSWGTFTLTPLP